MQNADMTNAFTITRLPDSTLNGQSVAVFEIVIDYSAIAKLNGYG